MSVMAHLNFPFFVILVTTFTCSVYGNLSLTDSNNFDSTTTCGERIFVEDAVVIDITSHQHCNWEIETHKNRILVFSVIDGNLDLVQDFIAIHEGIGNESLILFGEKQMPFDSLKKDWRISVYTSDSSARLQFKKLSTSKFQLKIQKAVSCPVNLGTGTECGRVVDEISCYCLVKFEDNWPSHKTFCNQHGMQLLSIETQIEEESIKKAWPLINSDYYVWTSLVYLSTEKVWRWDSTNRNLYPGYANWQGAQPSDPVGGCMHLCHGYGGKWEDQDCASFSGEAMCELQP